VPAAAEDRVGLGRVEMVAAVREPPLVDGGLVHVDLAVEAVYEVQPFQRGRNGVADRPPPRGLVAGRCGGVADAGDRAQPRPVPVPGVGGQFGPVVGQQGLDQVWFVGVAGVCPDPPQDRNQPVRAVAAVQVARGVAAVAVGAPDQGASTHWLWTSFMLLGTRERRWCQARRLSTGSAGHDERARSRRVQVGHRSLHEEATSSAVSTRTAAGCHRGGKVLRCRLARKRQSMPSGAARDRIHATGLVGSPRCRTS